MKKQIVRVLRLWDKMPEGSYVVSTVSKSQTAWERQLSPFVLGPCDLYDELTSRNMENAWQFAKVYREHLDGDKIRPEYWEWAYRGWDDRRAHRYPMGKGRRPEFSLWCGERLGYVEARKRIYVMLYAEAVMRTQAYLHLRRLLNKHKDLTLLDYDAYDHHAMGMSLTDVLNNPHRKMGHAFVLAMLLTSDRAIYSILDNR